ncbi:MAG TPA: flagellar basal body rod protein FlgF [Gammaproteobacteria bacterium]|nr:flagellar basal body rod protein FlgF [Gammaproteobacteria bacterium]
MDRSVYVAMTGAKQTMLAQAVTSHNLANVSTTGFRADLASFQSAPVPGPGLDSRANAVVVEQSVDFQPGPVITTGRDLDFAVRGRGWIAVQAKDGGEAYTRAGELHVTDGGLLTTSSGEWVLGNNGPVSVPPFETLEIGNDGTLSIRPVGQTPSTLAVVDRIKLVKPPEADLVKGGDGLFRLRDGGNAPVDASVSLVGGALEGSNVNSVEAMVTMMELARQFEMHVQFLKTAEENETAVTQIMRMG